MSYTPRYGKKQPKNNKKAIGGVIVGNGRRRGLKILQWRHLVGSNPSRPIGY